MKLSSLYRALCGLSVFSHLWKTPLFAALDAYMAAEGEAARARAYAALVATLYEAGASLPAAVREDVLSDENIWVRTVGEGRAVPPTVRETGERELLLLSELAALAPADFAADMGVAPDTLASFETGALALLPEYEARLAGISRYGYGMFARHAMFALDAAGEITPVGAPDTVSLDSFVGYAEERGQVEDNTLALLRGLPAANVLLYGDAGTGKSSTVKALVNRYFADGLRLIELRKDQLLLLPQVMARIAKNPLKFILFIDDLSFTENDDRFAMLKATLEGSACAQADNAVIYATSNRRHILCESFTDRENDVHRNDSMQEALSLSERFGLTVLFSKPDKPLYLSIVFELAARHGITRDRDTLAREAEAFAIRRGTRSARLAEQFIDSLLSNPEN